jgi:hypothetical protein
LFCCASHALDVFDLASLTGPKLVPLSAKKVSGMGNRRTRAHRGGDQSGFRQLRVGGTRVAGV